MKRISEYQLHYRFALSKKQRISGIRFPCLLWEQYERCYIIWSGYLQSNALMKMPIEFGRYLVKRTNAMQKIL